MRFTVISDQDERGYVLMAMQRPTLLEALRLACLLWRKPTKYHVVVCVKGEWIAQNCIAAKAGQEFDAPLRMEK
jgi:hypothetical protein